MNQKKNIDLTTIKINRRIHRNVTQANKTSYSMYMVAQIFFCFAPVKGKCITSMRCISNGHKNNMFGHKFNAIANIEHGLNFYTMQYKCWQILYYIRHCGLYLFLKIHVCVNKNWNYIHLGFP